jgi:hypothetical protein
MPSMDMGIGSSGMSSEPGSGFGSEGESSSSMGSGGSERIKIGERPPEQTWPGGGSR